MCGPPANSATQGSTHFVTNTTYNAASQPLTISYGSGDSDTYTYDPNTGRSASYTFTVGSPAKSLVGNLKWNPNGKLQQLAVTDGFYSAGTQTCNYGSSGVAGYDDLGRLVSANCGSVWAQTFSYDPFGNITKSGSSSWILSEAERVEGSPCKKEKATFISECGLYLCRQRPTLPHTFACSTIGPAGLNFRVRDGNGWIPRGKITDFLSSF